MKVDTGPAVADALQVELCMSTHLAVVVNLRMDFGLAAEYVGLVIPRSHCCGDRPSRHALLSAARDFLARWHLSGREKQAVPSGCLARINGQWTSLLALPGPGACLA